MIVAELGINILKYGYLRTKSMALAELFDWLREPMFNYVPDKEKQILDGAFRKYYAISRIGYSINTVCVVLWYIKMLSDENQMPSKLFGNENVYLKSFMYFLLTIGFFYTGIANMSFNLIVIGLIYHAALQVRIIKSLMGNLYEYANEQPDNLKSEVVYRQIAHCARRYWLVKSFVASIESTFSLPLFFQLCVSILVNCFVCLQFLMSDTLSFTIIFPIIALFAVTLEEFMYCFIGNLIFEETSQFNTDLYLTDWIELDVKCRKAFIFLRENSKKPIVIRAGKLLDLSLQTFAMLVRRSYSLQTVVFRYKS
ncbi:unnamed protein product [Ceutorhynchus assimilis]|uniref:Odorant receptor n=1 Tax=Ceutorhynchus assimilis TaxID=467358 RepID=A0A9N9MR42_9CUCU|nr:unnamed protein product [Ceutorhynchus assimilis]